MGICDYVCYIQRNGQNLFPLELLQDGEEDKETDSWSMPEEAIIVMIPDTYSREDILGWDLSCFRKFPTLRKPYSSDDWCFPGLRGYRKLLMESDQEGRDLAVWKSKTYPGRWLVNFDPEAYRVFVGSIPDTQTINRIPRQYLEEVLGRTADIPKECMVDMILRNDY